MKRLAHFIENYRWDPGIWTKHLKAKTSLHQTVIDRCLKTLTQKRLIKRVQSVQHITRKIYMLEGVEPSISLTGGPWYTDNELDTEFIHNLTEACYKLISDIVSYFFPCVLRDLLFFVFEF